MTRPLILLLGLLLLAGCAVQTSTLVEPRQSGDWSAQLEELKALERWRLAGKVGLRTADDATSANLDWQQTPFFYRMMISGPFGAGRSTLDGSTNGVTLTTPDGRFSASTPEQLMQQQLGWSLPISALDYWVRGLPAPDVAHEMQSDAQGFPQQLRQAGWTIDYRDWTWAPRLNGGLWLPQRLVMTFDNLRATLVVNQWWPLDTGTS
nr:lipoprotein insertase outer membrane protein LolB [uncultured Halomonas sp.]